MELPLKVMVIAIILLVVFFVLVGLSISWGGQSNNIFEGMMQWFGDLQKNPGQINQNQDNGGQGGDQTPQQTEKTTVIIESDNIHKDGT